MHLINIVCETAAILSRPQCVNLHSEELLHCYWGNRILAIKWEMLSISNPMPHIMHIEAETNGRHFADDIFKCILFNENVWISIQISLKFVPKGPINNIPALVQIMACRLDGVKPLSEPMMVRLSTHICVTRLQWVKPKHAENMS